MRNVLSACRQTRGPPTRHVYGLEQRRGVRWQDDRTKNDQLPEHEIRRDAHQSFRVRRDGKEELPLPPFLDPVVHADHMKYTKLDEQQWDVATPNEGFRQELAANPYVAALTTPIRGCDITAIRLPRHFMRAYKLLKTPEAERKLSLTPCMGNGTTNGGNYLPSTSYCANHIDVHKYMARKHNWSRLVCPRQLATAAAYLDRSPQSLAVQRTIQWDSGNVEVLETDLLHTVREEWDALEREHSNLLIAEEDALSRLEEVILFIQLVKGSDSIACLHDKPLFCLPLTSEDSSDTVPRALLRHSLTIPLAKALERLRQWKHGNNG